ncbi:hypothetical protein KVMX100_170125 [Klebsiella variicola]|nr:hypothetical protein KVMX100_170125 [Klebsiella variicola]
MIARHQGVGADCQRFFLGDIQERAVIADAGFNIKAGAFNAIKITGNQGKFAACHTLCLSKEKNKAGFAG